jgi:hypothetical protein
MKKKKNTHLFSLIRALAISSTSGIDSADSMLKNARAEVPRRPEMLSVTGVLYYFDKKNIEKN